MSALATRRLRLPLSAQSLDAPRDVLTGNPPKAWRGNPLSVEFAIFSGAGALVDDFSNVETVQLEIKATPIATENLIAPDALDVGDLNDALTLLQWAGGTAYHGAIPITATQMNIAMESGKAFRDCWLVISITRTDAEPVTLGAMDFRIYEDGAGFDAGEAPENPGSAQTRAQVLALIDAASVFRADLTSWANLAALTTTGGDPDAVIGDVKQFVTGGSLKTVQLTASTEATNTPFSQRPDDYAAQSTKLVWINVG